MKSAYTIKRGQDRVTKCMIRVFSDPTSSSTTLQTTRSYKARREQLVLHHLCMSIFVYMCARHSYFMERKTRICIQSNCIYEEVVRSLDILLYSMKRIYYIQPIQKNVNSTCQIQANCNPYTHTNIRLISCFSHVFMRFIRK